MASLGEQLAALRERVNLKPEVWSLVRRHFDELTNKLLDYGALSRGDVFPAFELLDHQGVSVRSKDLLARGPLVVSLFRGTWCPYCDLELRFLNEIYGGIRNLGAELVVISPQSPESAREYLAAHPFEFRILVDPNARFATKLGLGYGFPDYLEDLYRNVFKIDLAKINSGGLWRLPVPARFVVNTDGSIADAEYHPDFRFRPEPAETLAALAALRTASLGDSCAFR